MTVIVLTAGPVIGLAVGSVFWFSAVQDSQAGDSGRDTAHAAAPPNDTFARVAKTYLQGKAGQITSGAVPVRTYTGVLTDEMARKATREAGILAERRRFHQSIDGGYGRAEVEVKPGRLKVDGDRATLEIKESTRRYFASVADGAPSHEAYALPHTLRFTRINGSWRLAEDRPAVIPGKPAPSTVL